VVTQLRRTSPPRAKQGFTVFFTGLSGSGKSTIANALMVKLMEMGGRPVTLLDGDVVRKHLSSNWASRKSTATSTSSASAMSRPRSPRTAASPSVRRSRPIPRPAAPCARWSSLWRLHRGPCRHLDRGMRTPRPQGPLQAGARRQDQGIHRHFRPLRRTPTNPELRVDTENVDVDNCAHQVLLKLEQMGLIGLTAAIAFRSARRETAARSAFEGPHEYPRPVRQPARRLD
jgi:sulfate adenylyltransferase